MSIFESIKEERKLSFSNWRYRLLHWCFNEKCDKPCDSGLPPFLYTHYCPLFHLTNFIALLAPIILMFKVGGVIIVAFLDLAINIHAKIDWSFLKQAERKPIIEPEPTMEEKQREQWRQLFKQTSIHYETTSHLDNSLGFEDFWDKWGFRFDLLDTDEVRQRYELLFARIKNSKEAAEARNKRMRDSIVFWVNFSRAFVKWILYAFYFGVAAVSLWLVSISVLPFIYAVISFFTWIFNFNFLSLLPYLVIAVKFGMVAGVIMGMLALFRKFGVVQTCVRAIGTGVVTCAPPFVLMGKVGAAPFKWGLQGCCNLADFTVMFYEENCPPITIVCEDEEAFEEELS